MSHHRLDHLRMCACHRQPSTTGVPQGMEVQMFALLVDVQQEIALLSSQVLVWVIPGIFQPHPASL
ncbi:MAG: hypothetical protein ABI614_20925 [Planctomycetota bacterium]